MDNKIGFIGAGNMGSTIIKGLAASKVRAPSDIIVSDTNRSAMDTLAQQVPGIQTTGDNHQAASCPILILAVKPQVYETVINDIRKEISKSTIVVTIAAGLTLDTVMGWFDGHEKIVRTMPNTPALVFEGITALCGAPGVLPTDLELVKSIFDAVGGTLILEEKYFDAFTALAGSSPAWVFMFLEALADGAVCEGLPRETAYEIAAQAVLGSAKLARESGEHPGVLKDRVSSPGGTTIEGIAALEERGFRSSIIQAFRDCTRRSRELGRGNEKP